VKAKSVTAKKPAAKAARPGRKPRRAATAGGDPIARLRALCLALPETTERLSHGEPTWFVRDKKTFVTSSDHHHDDRLAFWCAGADGAQEVLVSTEPRKFFRPPYVGHRGWIGVYLDVPEVDWDQIADLVVEAYRQVAPKRLVAELDGG
jgi:hypothetical protein